MKSLTVTYHHTCNYGAVLQAYALQQAIQKLGHENVILEYKEASSRKRKKSWKQALANLVYKFYGFLHGEEHKILVEYFKNFHDRLKLTRPYNGMEDLVADCPKVDALITGSDQVFNLRTMPSLVDARFLNFGDEGMLRFSYAASMEKQDYSLQEKDFVHSSLKKFKGVALRESVACDYFRSFISDIEFKHVLDPVFLLTQEEWLKIAKVPRIKRPYILVYQVQRNEKIAKVAKLLKKKTGYPIVSICNSTVKWIEADYSLFDVSPEEFIGFYKDAAMVVGASFHGVALGLVFNKPTFGLVKKGGSNRIGDMLNRYDLGRYCINEKADVKEASECLNWAEDMELLQTRIDGDVVQSYAYLKEMFGDK